jgi:hypothetical protein
LKLFSFNGLGAEGAAKFGEEVSKFVNLTNLNLNIE